MVRPMELDGIGNLTICGCFVHSGADIPRLASARKRHIQQKQVVRLSGVSMKELGRIPRNYVTETMREGAEIALSRGQAHYLLSVMRLKQGDTIRLFNGQDGEWLCELTVHSKKSAGAKCLRRLCDPTALPDIEYVFAPLKSARLDYLAQKATELGVCRLRPVITERTVPSRVNIERLTANVIEAAEQCNLVALPEVLDPVGFDELVTNWNTERSLIYCDEALAPSDALSALGNVRRGPLAVLVGPEGGFSDNERKQLRNLECVVPISLGPRIMRADTAAVAALALVQAVHGDWSTDQQT